MREEVTYHTCYSTKNDLIEQVKRFEQQFNQGPLALSQRLWVKTQMDPDVEKTTVFNLDEVYSTRCC